MTLQTDGPRGDAVPTPAPEEGRGDEKTHKLFLGTFIHSQSLGELRHTRFRRCRGTTKIARYNDPSSK
ncbi:guanine deaminase [Magnaporthiopsis poae ATCC 64411]|uniref:Guanine deaminase n=1 Tax=Magnaporthiopsis poae (strain ATCC 64411 / 73-15) TaxID=644358 RepID=A0A0C4DP86_MAGP6|nr:guanine deaminase [Magnaporthiopsis poae ATCC 64411]